MDIKTKFNIGDKVYTCKYESEFVAGSFIDTCCPITESYIITKIIINITQLFTVIRYEFSNGLSRSENELFNSLEEVTNYCKNKYKND